MRIYHSSLIGLIIRLIIIIYSVQLESGSGSGSGSDSSIRYTDLDYQVFSDAAKSMISNKNFNRAITKDQKNLFYNHHLNLNLGSPYDRSTYRYTPILAILMIPNHLFHQTWGKLLFCVSDIIIGVLVYKLLLIERSDHQTTTAVVLSIVRLVILTWTFNPFVINISTRGSSESILGVLLLLLLYLTKIKSLDLAAILLGVSVHFKLYPIIYSTSIWSSLSHRSDDGSVKILRGLLTFERRKIRFGLIALSTLSILNLIMYSIWGYRFIESSYLYHFTRLDHRHNFSAYFYPIYLSLTSSSSSSSSSSSQNLQANLQPILKASYHHEIFFYYYYYYLSKFLSILKPLTISFLPQSILSLGLGLYFGHRDLSFAMFIQTYAFVSLNRVITSQYFMWYLWFIPLIVKKIRLSRVETILIISSWITSQALWLFKAYQLEILGKPVFRSLWFCSIIFLLTNAWIMGTLINGFLRPSNLILQKQKTK
ncbi:PIG-M-domain-containing protein [Phakopsora pachyrhizi]|nr:PIG-M-domain-containing protein [Phakopsora pachyrhizi]